MKIRIIKRTDYVNVRRKKKHKEAENIVAEDSWQYNDISDRFHPNQLKPPDAM